MDKKIIKEEAIKRMKKLELMDDVISLFSKEDRLYYSERQNKQFPATLYWLDNNEEYTKLVKEFEKKTGYVVYHCILTRTSFGTILDMLFVSKYEEEWEYELEEVNGKYYAMSNARNLTDENLSDMGTIVIRPVMGGIERIG